MTIVTALVFGLVPALKTTKPDIGKTLKDQAGAVVGGGSTVTAEFGFCVRKVSSLGELHAPIRMCFGIGDGL